MKNDMKNDMETENGNGSQMILEAVRWVTSGYAVIPCKPMDKRPALSQWKKYQAELPSAADIERWFVCGVCETNNLAVITGWKNLVVIDFDDLAKYVEWRGFIEDHNPEAVNTYQVMTGRGVHVYYRIMKPVLTQKLDRIDIKARGGYVLAPPSIHPTGGFYWSLCDLPIMEIVSIKDVLPLNWLGLRDKSAVRKITPVNARINSPVIKNLIKPDIPTGMKDSKQSDPWAIAEDPGESEDVITRIRNRISILDYFPGAIKTSQGFYLAQCPFHDDHNPSFWINTEKQICNCYKCQFTPMDVINLHSNLNNVSNAQAIRDLRGLMETR